MIKQLRGSIMLFIAALIWGTAFVAQSEGMKYVEPFTYNAARMLIGSAVLLPIVILSEGRGMRAARGRTTNFKKTIIGGICCGCVLYAASSLQQVGIVTTTAGKAGFVTALYIVIVPLYGLILGKNTPKKIWLCAAVAIAGFYLLCIKEDFSISKGDIYTLFSAFFFAGHIMTIDHFNNGGTNPVMMACIQFFVSGVLALFTTLIFEDPHWNEIIAAGGTILYCGIMSSGIAYTFQILGQRHTNATVATLIMSLESVVAAVSGCLILHESMLFKEWLGCALVFTAVIFAQINVPFRRKRGKTAENV